LNASAQRTKEIFALRRANAKIPNLRHYALRRWMEGAIGWEIVVDALD
jgi:hypothetical protein